MSETVAVERIPGRASGGAGETLNPAQLTAVAGRAPDREAVLRDILHP